MEYELELPDFMLDFMNHSKKFYKKLAASPSHTLSTITDYFYVLKEAVPTMEKIIVPLNLAYEMKTTYADCFDKSMLDEIEQIVKVDTHDKKTIIVKVKEK